MGESTLALGSAAVLVLDICVTIGLLAMLIAVLIFWLQGCFRDTERAAIFRNSMSANADCADVWLNKYYEEKREHADSVSFYTGALERKDKKIDTMTKMDAQRIKRIKQLEDQLRDNGIEPEVWDFVA